MLGIKEIKEIIPHRHPFLLVDCIEELEPGVRAVGYKAVTYNEPYFSGHFPEEPVMPGVLIVEALAQTGAVAVLSMEENKGKTAYFGGMDRVKFKKKVVPGDRLRLECEIIKRKGPVVLSLSEHLAFLTSYLSASGCIVLMVSCYVGFALRNYKEGIGIGVLLVALYSLLYTILQMEDYALLMGTALLLVMLAALMVVSRNLARGNK